MVPVDAAIPRTAKLLIVDSAYAFQAVVPMVNQISRFLRAHDRLVKRLQQQCLKHALNLITSNRCGAYRNTYVT